MLRFRIFRLLPFMARWAEITPACCGICPTCVGAAVGATLLPLIVPERKSE